MALADPTGPISLLADRLATTLGQVAAWTALTGTIHHNQLTPAANGIEHSRAELLALRPFALIWTEAYKATRSTAGGGLCVEHSGQCVIRIERNVPADMTPAEAERDWENIVGRIIQTADASNPGLMDLASDPRYIPIDEISLIEHNRTHPDHLKDIGDAQRAFLLVEYST